MFCKGLLFIVIKSLYSLVQAARQWYKKIAYIFAKLDFIASSADPCLFVKKKKANEVPASIILYVDDGAIIGTDEVMTVLGKAFQVKDLGKMKHFLVAILLRIKRKIPSTFTNQS
jgi:Reverse transcriptase (RNA-dependent DNA polymerase)